MRKKFDYVTCKKCLWIYFRVSYDHAEKEMNDFNRFFYSQTDEVKALYGSKPSWMLNYDHCGRCGNSYKNFRRALKKEIPNGSTISGILDFKEKVVHKPRTEK